MLSERKFLLKNYAVQHKNTNFVSVFMVNDFKVTNHCRDDKLLC